MSHHYPVKCCLCHRMVKPTRLKPRKYCNYHRWLSNKFRDFKRYTSALSLPEFMLYVDAGLIHINLTALDNERFEVIER